MNARALSATRRVEPRRAARVASTNGDVGCARTRLSPFASTDDDDDVVDDDDARDARDGGA